MDMLPTPADTSNKQSVIPQTENLPSWRPEMLDVQRRNAHVTLPEPPAPVRYFLHVMAPALHDEVVL